MNNAPLRRRGLMLSPQGLVQAKEPGEWQQAMRAASPVHFDEARGCWDVFLYEDVLTVLSDYKRFSSARNLQGQQETLINMDPPKHMRYRTLVSQAFTLKAVQNLAPRIEELARELIDEVLDQGEIDLVERISFPLPVIVIAELLGVPKADIDKFKHWSDLMVQGVDLSAGEDYQTLMRAKQQAMGELHQYFGAIIQERRIRREQDMISALLDAKVDDQHLELPELLSFCFLLLVAGNETTTNLITNSIYTFLEDRTRYEQLLNDRSLLTGAIEEVLRFRSPVQSMSRIAAADLELGGRQIKQCDELIAWIGSANLDERKFPDADSFRIDRTPNQHLAFGHGVHFCLGAPLARLEAQIALNAILTKLPNLRRVDGQEPQKIASPIVYGFKNLQVQF
ncbi:cytochrome P450 [Tumebacillus sp. BK434]|uniref:cytochrome P450 n=1 Tax=Tumebacillus sp. BK434 TaxID=2512169 RepID=UPI0010E907E6|nr:cytochrome P450 [Tumebacillus sp. BK434]TCP57956.1 cytochrome P450 [Tumebacillus sp. BK434]